MAYREVKDDIDGSVDSWCMRRREASDDDDDSANSTDGDKDVRTCNRKDGFGFDDQLEGAGGAPEEGSDDDEVDDSEVEGELVEEVPEGKHAEEDEGQNRNENNAPVIPKIGAFYMHDDRFGRRVRPGSGRQQLKEFKDERKWQHDKFQDIKFRSSRSQNFNAYANVRGTSGCYTRGSYGNQGRRCDVNNRSGQFMNNDYYNNQGYTPRPIRGRGFVKYQPRQSHGYGNTGTRNEEKPPGMDFNTDSKLDGLHASKVGSDSLATEANKMHHHASSSGPGIFVKRGVNPKKIKERLPSDNAWLMQGESSTDFIDCNRLNANEFANPTIQSGYANVLLQSSSSRYNDESPQRLGRVTHRPLHEMMSHMCLASSNQVDNLYPIGNHHAVQQTSSESVIRSHLQDYNQAYNPHSVIGSKPFLAPSSSGYDPGDIESFAVSRKSEPVWAERRSGDAQAYRRGSDFSETYDRHTSNAPHLLTMQFGDCLSKGTLREHDIHHIVARCLDQPDLGSENAGMIRSSFLPDNYGHLASRVTSAGAYPSFSMEQSSTDILSEAVDTGIPSKPPDETGIVSDQSKAQKFTPKRYSRMNFKR